MIAAALGVSGCSVLHKGKKSSTPVLGARSGGTKWHVL